MANEFGVSPQEAVPTPPARFFPTGAGTQTTRAIQEFVGTANGILDSYQKTKDALAVTEYNKRAALLNADLMAGPTGDVDEDLRAFRSHEKMYEEYLGTLSPLTRSRVEGRIQTVTTSRWMEAFGANTSRMRQEAKDNVNSLLTNIAAFGADMDPVELEGMAGEAQVAIRALGEQGEETKNLTERLGRTFKNVRIERGKRFADADVVGVSPESQARLGAAVQDISSFRAAYGADMNETHLRRYASAYEAKVKAEEREQRRILRENRMNARMMRIEDERALMASVTNASRAYGDAVAVTKESPTAPVDWGGVLAEFKGLQQEAQRVAARGGPSARRFAETSGKILNEIEARRDAQELLMSGPGGVRALAEKAQELAASDAPVEVKRAYLEMAQSTRSFIQENGPAALAAAQRGTGVKPMTSPVAWEESRTVREEYGGGTGITKGQAEDTLTTVTGEDRALAARSLGAIQKAAPPEDRGLLADEIRRLDTGSKTQRSVLAGVLGSDLSETENTAIADGLARLEQGEWLDAEKLLYGTKGLSNSMRDQLMDAFPDPVLRNDVVNAITALYLGSGGGTLDEFDKGDWEDTAERLWSGEEFRKVNGRTTLVPADLDFKGKLREAGATGLRIYGNGDPDLGGERFDAFLSEAQPIRVAPGKYAFFGEGGGTIKTKEDGRTYILDLQELVDMNPGLEVQGRRPETLPERLGP